MARLTRRHALPMLALLAMLIPCVGCEGDIGPAGPAGSTGLTGLSGEDGEDSMSLIITFASVNAWGTPETPVVEAFGPPGVTIDVTYQAPGRHTVTIDGQFPDSEPILILSGTSAVSPEADTFVTGDIVTWSDSQIEFDVSIWSAAANNYVDDAFSFVLFAQVPLP